MKIEKGDHQLKISNWNNRNPFNGSIIIGIISSFFYFFIGLRAFIIACLVMFIFLVIIQVISAFTNYSIIILDFKLKTIVSSNTFSGFTLKKLKLNHVNFDNLYFKEFVGNGGGFKKYVLEYKEKDSITPLYKVNRKKHKERIENEIQNCLIGKEDKIHYPS